MIKEWLARSLVILGLIIVVSIPVVGRWHGNDATNVHARMAESGGWTPENLSVKVGEQLHLRLTSDDVTHGFAVGQLNQPAVEIKPGEMTDITLVFTRLGKYTFYCTKWCSLNHWRMRGTIEVTGQVASPEPSSSPLYVRLGLDIDAAHQADVIPSQIPSAWRGALLNRAVANDYKSREYYQAHTPLDLWLALRSEPGNTHLTDGDIWDLVAWVWQSNTTPEQIQAGKALFAANCAACHGEDGTGDGVFAGQLAAGEALAMGDQKMGEHTLRPADFTDPVRMLSASPALLQGKILRGGMGSGMPSWGAIFTQDQTWALIAYLWTHQFNLEVKP